MQPHAKNALSNLQIIEKMKPLHQQLLTGLFALVLLIYSCKETPKQPTILEEKETTDINYDAPKSLSEFGMFRQPIAAMQPIAGVEPYELNATLFSDYAYKKRFIYLPKGQHLSYNPTEMLGFPDGSLLFKFFYYPNDFRQPEGPRRIMETRVLKKKDNKWTAFSYLWNDEQTDATLALAGDTKPVSWVNLAGEKINEKYSIPNVNQCKSCHSFHNETLPIGPVIRQLNKNIAYPSGTENQLTHLQKIGWLPDLPALEKCPKLDAWDDQTVALDKRARAYLEVNCGHCHRPEGPARNSGLELLASVTDPAKFGVGKKPVAAGQGSGGFMYDILPKHPDKSILVYRMESDNPGIMMPEIGRKKVHAEGVALIKNWIAAMK